MRVSSNAGDMIIRKRKVSLRLDDYEFKKHEIFSKPIKSTFIPSRFSPKKMVVDGIIPISMFRSEECKIVDKMRDSFVSAAKQI